MKKTKVDAVKVLLDADWTVDEIKEVLDNIDAKITIDYHYSVPTYSPISINYPTLPMPEKITFRNNTRTIEG